MQKIFLIIVFIFHVILTVNGFTPGKKNILNSRLYDCFPCNTNEPSGIFKNNFFTPGLFSNLRLAINAGWSRRTAKVPNDLHPAFKQYVENLREGYNFGGDIIYFFSEQMGFGLKYYSHFYSNQLDSVYVVMPTGAKIYGKMSDDITINYFSPTFCTRFLHADKKNAFLINLSMGYLNYIDLGEIVGYILTINGSTLGFSIDLGYDIRISKQFSLGLQFTVLTGTLSKIEISDGINKITKQLNNEEKESLTTLNLSLGIRYNHFRNYSTPTNYE